MSPADEQFNREVLELLELAADWLVSGDHDPKHVLSDAAEELHGRMGVYSKTDANEHFRAAFYRWISIPRPDNVAKDEIKLHKLIIAAQQLRRELGL